MVTDAGNNETRYESSNLTQAQLQEVQSGLYVSCKQIAKELGYTTAWISYKCKLGQIKAVKPMGGQWRIPKSEYDRLKREGFPIVPQERPKPKAKEIHVPDEQLSRVAPEKVPKPAPPDPEQPQEKKRYGFSDIFTMTGMFKEKE